MQQFRRIVLNGRPLLTKAKWCDTFAAKLRGFTFRNHLGVEDSLVLVEKSDNRLNSSIHMLFVSFDLGVIWVNQAGQVVDIVLAKSWRLSYAPKAPACYVIELHPNLLSSVKIGDNITFEEIKP
jgi:hypothetical protein